MPPADPRTRDERYDDTRECNAPRAGRKAVCIFHAGAAPAVIENIYMLFMGHTCFRNQTRYRATPRFSLRALSLSHSLLVHLSHANPFFSASFPSTASLFLFRRSAGNGVFRCRSLSQLLHPLPRSKPPGPAGNVSRILQNVSRLSYCFHFLPTVETTNTRMD